MYLTEKQKRVYQYIKEYIETNQIAPSFDEIRQHFGFSSFSTVHSYIQILEKKGVLSTGKSNEKRALQLTELPQSAVAIPLVGRVAAGSPIEVFDVGENISVPEEILANGENVALEIKGNSMIDTGIYEGDVVIVKKQPKAENGQIAVCLVDNQATIKRVYVSRNKIELRPCNQEMEPIYVTPDCDFRIFGILVGLYRKYR